MADQPEDGTLAHHLGHLAVSADDLTAFLTRKHEEGEIQMEPLAQAEHLAKSEHLASSLRDVIHALGHHEHLAMGKDDVWKALTLKHQEHQPGETIT